MREKKVWGREEIWRNSKASFHFDAYFLPYGNVSHVTCLGYHLPLIIPCLVINPTTPIPSSHNFMCLLCSPIPSNNCTTTHKGRWKPCLYLLLFFLWSLCEEEEGEWCCSEKGPFLRLETQTHWHSWGIPETRIIFGQWGLDGHVPMCSYPRGFWVHKRSSV